MKYKHVIIASVLFFLLINTQYLWEGQTGMFGLPILIIYYIILIGKFIQYVYVSFKEKWKIRQRNIALGVICFVLIITAMFPFGIIPYHKFEQNVFVFGQEAAAGCTATLRFKHNNTFVEKHVCFGVYKYRGEYELRNDTIYLTRTNKNSSFRDRKFGIISRNGEFLELYEDENDTFPYPMHRLTTNL